MKPQKIPADLQLWIEARRRHRLSHAHVQMARELGLNPRKLGKIDNHDQEPWKLPLPEFIEKIYRKRFHKDTPDEVVSIEERAKRIAEKKAARKTRREAEREGKAAAESASGFTDRLLPAPAAVDHSRG